MDVKKQAYIKLVVRRLYDAQKLRIQSDLRLQRLIREGIVLKEDAEKVFAKALEHEQAAEREYEKIVWREVKDLPIIIKWLDHVRGIGPRLSGLLVANIGDIAKFPNVAKLWAYAGLHVVDGRAAKRAKGEKANWNAELKTTAWKIAGSFLKAGGPYKQMYDTYRVRLVEREVTKGNIVWGKPASGSKYTAVHIPAGTEPGKPPTNPEWTLGRMHNMAMRRTAKMFLSHLWHAWREIEGLPIRPSYAQEYLGHESYIGPWEILELQKAAKAAKAG